MASSSSSSDCALILGVLPSPPPPSKWYANPIDPATGLAPSPPRLPLPPLWGAVDLSDGALPVPPPSHVCTDALLEDVLDSLLVVTATDLASFAAQAALRAEEGAWRRGQGGALRCPGTPAPTSLELLAISFRGCMTAFLQRQCDYAALAAKLCAKAPRAVDTEAFLRQEMLLLGRAAAHYFSAYHRALGRSHAPVTWGTMLAEFRAGERS
jgi:hypothetical protein